MRGITCFALILFVLTSCGYNPDKKAYDTTGNPEKFPPRALALIDGIESGKLGTFDTITASFADLYTEHPELLDNSPWRDVVGRLGAKFKSRAEQLASQGPSMFSTAARFFTLAAFARPQDERLQANTRLFGVWEKAVLDSVVPPDFDPDNKKLPLSEQLMVLKYFMLSDSLHQEFGKEYLVPHLLDVHTASSALKSDSPGGLSPDDRCFLLSLGYKGRLPSTTLASFGEPKIDLVSMRISRQAGSWYAAEFYFMPHEKLTSDYRVAFRLFSTDTTLSGPERQLAFDFHPEARSTDWKPGFIATAYRRFIYTGPPTQALVGLYERIADSTHFVPLRDSGTPLYTSPATVFAQR